jgi:hypothetical protein
LSTNLLQPSRFLAINLRLFQLCFPLSFSVVRRHEYLGLPLPRVPCGFHCRAASHGSLSSLRSVCPIQPNLPCLISLLMLAGAIWRQKQPHIASDCVALAGLRFRRLGKYLMEPRDYDEIPLCKIMYFVRGTGLLAE